MEDAQDQEQELALSAQALEEQLAGLPRTFAGMTLELALPRRLSERDAIVHAMGDVGDRTQMVALVSAAAVMLCWPAALRKPGVPRYRGDIIDYGGLAYDFLLGHGADAVDILRVGSVAVGLCTRAYVAQQLAAQAARGNSEAPKGGSSESRSPSSSASGSGGVASVALTPKTPGS